ncbi:hypothetical protein PENTCL1PPCAC_18309, partial [Pristionchus entomophagus]
FSHNIFTSFESVSHDRCDSIPLAQSNIRKKTLEGHFDRLFLSRSQKEEYRTDTVVLSGSRFHLEHDRRESIVVHFDIFRLSIVSSSEK